MKIYTKTGDKGQTSLYGGTRVSKNHERINAYGTIDELNSFIGMVGDLDSDQERVAFYRTVQSRLFTIGASLAAETDRTQNIKPDLEEDDILALENAIDAMNASLPAMKNFILPGGHQLVSSTHIARTVCRRAERLVISLADNVEVEDVIVKYLNRLSDYLFVLARKQGQELNIQEIPWKPRG